MPNLQQHNLQEYNKLLIQDKEELRIAKVLRVDARNPNIISQPRIRFHQCERSNLKEWTILVQAWDTWGIGIKQQRQWIKEFVETKPVLNPQTGFYHEWAGNEIVTYRELPS